MVGVFVMVGVIGIFAAIAFPAYNDYLSRAKVAEAVGELAALKPQITEFLASESRCPANDDAGSSHPSSTRASG